MGKATILLGSEGFMQRLEEAASKATRSFYAQAMTFEGDAAGQHLIEIMKASPAEDKRLLIDSYSKLVINDHFIPSLKYLRDGDFRSEVKNTKRLVEEARENGIAVTFTNPLGWMALKYPLRNHKKMVILDSEVSFLGGINFSDHNFAWHDMMVQLSDRELGKALSEDFECTWQGINQSRAINTELGTLYLFSGIKSRQLYDDFFDHIRAAKKQVQVISPYISEPLLSVLKQVASGGVEVVVISPQENNKSIFRNLILSEQEKGYFQLKEYPGMSHMKAILIDDDKLIFGSSNYDLVSYYFEQEVVFVSRDADLIHTFKACVLADVRDFEAEAVSAFDKKKAHILMGTLNRVGGFFARTFLRPY